MSANVKSLETGDWYKDRIGPDKLGGGQWAKDRLGIGGQDAGKAWKRSGFAPDFAKEGLAGGGWMDRLGINKGNKMGLTNIGNKLAMARDDFRSSLGEAGLGIPGAYEGGEWMDRVGMRESNREGLNDLLRGFDNPNFSKDWGGGNWMTRIGLSEGDKTEISGWGDWHGEWKKNWEGGAWLKDRLGYGQFDKKGGGGGDSEASGTDDTTTTTTTEEKVIEEKMNQLTEDDPQEAARIAATRARRRRALKNKIGKRQTIRTSGRGAKQYA